MKRILTVVLCLAMVAGMALTVRADDFVLSQTWDDSILAGGIFDMYAWVGGDTDGYTYQWQVDLAFGDGSWSNLEDNADPYGYSGTKTYHMQMITPIGNGYINGTGWEDIPFRCVVTDKKTGVSRSTPNIFMNVFSSDDLTEFMAEKGIRLYTPSVAGASEATTSDDKTFYTSTEAGKTVKFLCGFNPPQNNPLMGRSDMVGKVEVWITEAGKTVKKEDGCSYTPYTIGRDAVTAEFKLHYTLGIHDMGYYETKTVKLSTSAPTVIGRGTAKQEMSLLKEPYSQSQKLVTIPRGQTVDVHTNSGSWYQVSYAGYVGYVAGSALSFEESKPAIDHVNVNIAAPGAGNIPATSCTVTPNTCMVTSVEWLDKTTDRFMEPGERFVKGHDYQLVIWAAAKEGYEFKLDGRDNMLTTATINGNLPAFTSRAYEQIIGKVIDIRYDFKNVQEAVAPHTCKPKAVARVAPTCTKAGREAYYKCSCGMAYADAAALNSVDLSTWGILPALGHKAGSWTGNATQHSQKCSLCQQMIPETTGQHTGGEATCNQKAICTTCGMQYGQLADHRWSPKRHAVDATGHAYQCADCKGYDTVIPHTPGPEATQKEPQVCTVCQYILKPADNHTHKLTKVEAVAATCVVSGNRDYYTCDGCSEWFWDEAGTKPIANRSDVQMEALGHFAERWSLDPEQHWQNCIVCSGEIAREEHRDQNEDGKCDVCENTSQGEAPAVQTEEPQQQETEPVEQIERPKPAGQNMYLWITLFAVIFATSLAVTVLVAKKKNKKEGSV